MKKIVPVIIALVFIIVGCAIIGMHYYLSDNDPTDNSMHNDSNIRVDSSYITHNTVEPKPAQDIVGGRLDLQYDDRFSFDSEVETIGDKDVLIVDDEDNTKVIATGCGTAKVLLKDGREVDVRVSKAKISLVLVAGQSNGEGRIAENQTLEDVKKQWVVNQEGSAYSTYGVSDSAVIEEILLSDISADPMTVNNYQDYLPQSLTNNSKNIPLTVTNRMTDAVNASGKGGLDSAFSYRWNQLTGEKVWIINACAHGESITSWQPDGDTDNNYWQAVELYKGAEKILSQEILEGHFELTHKGILWYQGERDYEMDPQDYYNQFNNMWNGFQTELSGEGIDGVEKDVDFIGILMVRAMMMQKHPENDFLLTGPRCVEYYLGTTAAADNIFIASHIEDIWTTDNAVESYFINQYSNNSFFNRAYPTISDNIKMPTTTADVHGYYHNSQLAYNEIGFDAAETACAYLNYYEDDKSRIGSIQMVLEDGKIDVSDGTINLKPNNTVPFAIKVYPASRTKDVAIYPSSNVRITPSGITLLDENVGNVRISINGYEKNLKIVPRQ